MKRTFFTQALLLLVALVPSLVAFDLETEVNKLKNQTFDLQKSGHYIMYDTERSMWLLYMPTANYLYYHDSSSERNGGYLSTKDYSYISISGHFLSFGSYQGGNAEGKLLGNRTFDLSNNYSSGYYINYDTADNMWLYYVPLNRYMFIHPGGQIPQGQTLWPDSWNEIDPSVSFNGTKALLHMSTTEELSSSSSSSLSSATTETDAVNEEPYGEYCFDGMVYDCSLNCVDKKKAWEYVGDGICDDGNYGYDLTCDAFTNDDGDCESNYAHYGDFSTAFSE